MAAALWAANDRLGFRHQIATFRLAFRMPRSIHVHPLKRGGLDGHLDMAWTWHGHVDIRESVIGVAQSVEGACIGPRVDQVALLYEVVEGSGEAGGDHASD